MPPDPSDVQATRKVLRRSCLLGGLGMLLAVGIHCLITRQCSAAFLGIEGVCILIYLLLALGMGTERLEPKFLGTLSGSAGMVATMALVHAGGGRLSPYFQVLGAMPFAIALFTPGTYLATLLTGAVSFGAVLVLDILFGMPTSTLWLQSLASATMLGVALYCSRAYWQMTVAKHEADQAHLHALERLAESERLRGRAERERAEVERLVLVGQLAAGVAHEVNNPLAFVKANLGLLREDAAGEETRMDREELRELLDETQQGVVRIQQIITDLRGVSRAGQDSEEQGGMLEEALREASRLASVRLGLDGAVTLDLPPQLPAVRLGQRHLVQVLVNLMLNAADAVESARPARQAHITVSARWEDDLAVILSVEDNGPGIPPDVLPRIFDPFFTTKPPDKGTGLGLALCQEYVSRAGGTLSAENRAEGGARFLVRLPVTLPAATPGGPRDPKPKVGFLDS